MNKYPTWQDVTRTQRKNKIRKFIEYTHKFWKYVPCFILSLVLWIFLRFILPIDFVSENSANYILSSVAQGLASTIALLFVIIFFICQSTNRASIFSHLLNPDGFLLLGAFVAAILFALIGLKTECKDALVNISISMCSFCLFALVPFVMVVKNLTTQFWIRNAIANLGFPIFQSNSFKYGEFLDELSKIGAKKIVNLEPEIIVVSIIDILDWLLSNETNFQNKSYSMSLIVKLGFFSLEEKECKGTLKHAMVKIRLILNDDTFHHYIGKESKFQIALSGMSSMLSLLKLHRKLEVETREFFAEGLIRSLGVLLYELYHMETTQTETNRLKSCQQKLEEVVRAYIRRELVHIEDFKASFENAVSPLEILREIREELKEYLDNLLSSI